MEIFDREGNISSGEPKGMKMVLKESNIKEYRLGEPEGMRKDWGKLNVKRKKLKESNIQGDSSGEL